MPLMLLCKVSGASGVLLVRGHGEPRMVRDPSLIAHHARRQLAVAAAWAACPHVALEPAEVDAADDAPEPAIGEVGAPRILPRPILHARGPVGAPAHELNAVAANIRRALGAVVDRLWVIVEEVAKVPEVVYASVQRAVGHHLDLHFPHLAVHCGHLGLGTRFLGPSPVEGLVRLAPGDAGWQVLLHDPTERVHCEHIRLDAGVGALLEVARVATVVVGVLARAEARCVRRTATCLCPIHL
mmetsp:Transcript_64703/g.166497  ORF Transcript_64703/g.166497 Transcript_64703/m.166497 type:complete len:241 (-) Transcript_64703:561-1283(-)